MAQSRQGGALNSVASEGGPGSGNFAPGHKGVPGMRGGSCVKKSGGVGGVGNVKLSASSCKSITESALGKIGDIDDFSGDKSGYGDGYYELVTKKGKTAVVNELKNSFKSKGAQFTKETTSGFSVKNKNDETYVVKVSSNRDGNTYEKGDKNFYVDVSYGE